MAAELRLHIDLCLAAIRMVEAGPSPNDLEPAPLIENWCVLRCPAGSPVICGKVIDHPCLGNRMIATPRLTALDAQMGWARTLNQCCRHDEPFAPVQADMKRGYPKSVLGRALEEFQMSGFMILEDVERLGVILE